MALLLLISSLFFVFLFSYCFFLLLLLSLPPFSMPFIVPRLKPLVFSVDTIAFAGAYVRR